MNDNLVEVQVKDNKIYAPLKEKWLGASNPVLFNSRRQYLRCHSD